MTKKRVSQEVFDDAVRDNMEAFGMSTEEAVQSAVEEFKLQGVDLSGIIKTGEQNTIEKHAVYGATQELAQQPQQSVIDTLLKEFNSDDNEARAQALAVAHRVDLVRLLLQLTCRDDGASIKAQQLRPKLLQLLAAVLQSNDTRADFAAVDGMNMLRALVQSSTEKNLDIVACCARCAAAAATKDETNKCALVDTQLCDDMLKMLTRDDADEDVVTACCAALRACMTHDDSRPPASKAFMHARRAAQEGAVPLLLSALQRCKGEEGIVAVLDTLRQIAANEEICGEIADGGGVRAALQLISNGHAAGAVIDKAACSLLWQLAGSDANKRTIVSESGIDAVLRVMQEHGVANGVADAALGLLASLMLRNPDVAQHAFDAGCPDMLLAYLTDNASSAGGLRQACQAVRNMVVRNVDLRKPMLDKGFEAALRDARQRSTPCRDVASAALRDLGLENYA